jgi:uncharacterized membrane protein YphA (DoxX/SURF4 family)
MHRSAPTRFELEGEGASLEELGRVRLDEGVRILLESEVDDHLHGAADLATLPVLRLLHEGVDARYFAAADQLGYVSCGVVHGDALNLQAEGFAVCLSHLASLSSVFFSVLVLSGVLPALIAVVFSQFILIVAVGVFLRGKAVADIDYFLLVDAFGEFDKLLLSYSIQAFRLVRVDLVGKVFPSRFLFLISEMRLICIVVALVSVVEPVVALDLLMFNAFPALFPLLPLLLFVLGNEGVQTDVGEIGDVTHD